MPRWSAEEEARYALANGLARDTLSRGAQPVYDQYKQAQREAKHALEFETPRDQLSATAQAVYDRLKTEGYRGPALPATSAPSRGRTSAEVREDILAMFKRANGKYARPFEGDRLAHLSVMGGNWEEYGSIVLQMAMLDTLLSIEEKLDKLTGA